MLEHRRDYDARGLSHVECGAEEDIRERLALAAAPVTDAGLREAAQRVYDRLSRAAGGEFMQDDIEALGAALSRQAEKETA
jgi:hypothetical protein